MTDLLYTKNDLDIALLKQKDDHFEQALACLAKVTGLL